MGHADQSMAAHYREGISDERLQAIADKVRGWLYPTKTKLKIAEEPGDSEAASA